MKKQSAIDRFQITGFVISTLISIAVGISTGDTVSSVILGLVLAALTQLFDLQVRMATSSERLENLSVDGIERAILSLRGVEVHHFADTAELYRYVSKRMQEAKKAIDDLTWGPAERGTTQAAEEAAEKYVQTIPTVGSKKNLTYREVMSFSAYDRFNHLNRAKTMLDKNLPGYRLRYYEFSQESMPPLLLFMIIDSEEVILASCRAPFLQSEREIQIAIKHPVIVKLFQDYYDTIWQGAQILKEGNRVESSELEKIKTRLSRNTPS